MHRISRRSFTKTLLATSGLVAVSGPAALAGPAAIIRRKIPSTGEAIPIMGIGTNRYGVGDAADARAPLREALARFHELGGKVIDTAPSYRSSESVLGDLMGDLGIGDDSFIATKVDRDGGREDSLAQLDESARRLHRPVIDLMQVHNLRDWENNIPLLQELKKDGRFRYIGITTSRSSQYGDFEAVMREQDLDFVQINYSLEQREAADRLLPLAKDRGMAVMINRAFGGGRIFKKVGDQPVPDWAKEFGCESWAQFLLKYAIGHPAATLSIPGMTKLHHVDDNFGASHGRLPTAEERQRQEAFYDSL